MRLNWTATGPTRFNLWWSVLDESKNDYQIASSSRNVKAIVVGHPAVTKQLGFQAEWNARCLENYKGMGGSRPSLLI